MKKILYALAVLASLAFASPGAHAQDAAPATTPVSSDVANPHALYGGVGIFGLYNVGYSYAVSPKFSVRGEYSDGLKYETQGTYEGVNATAVFKYQATGLYADWHPFGGTFRLVGGVSFNDAKLQANAASSGTATINNKPVSMAGEYYNVTVKMPDAMPYLGVGTGFNPSNKGFGMYFDFGFLIGKPEVKSETSLVASGKVTQADIDAQDQKIRDATSSLGVIPKVQVGVSYRF